MGRLLILVLLALVAVWLIRRAVLRSRARDAVSRKPDGPPPLKAGELVSCAHCGVNLPPAEARTLEGLPYCSEEHARLGPGDGK